MIVLSGSNIINLIILFGKTSLDASWCCFFSVWIIPSSTRHHFTLWDFWHHCVSFLLLQGTVNNQTGIFPESFVKIIKPLPESDSEGEGEGEGHTYSCLRCFLLTPSGVETRSVWHWWKKRFCSFMFTLYLMGDISNMLVMRPIPRLCILTHKSALIPQYQWHLMAAWHSPFSIVGILGIKYDFY